MYDRYDLEEAMGEMLATQNDIETLLYAIGDSPTKYSEDEILNVLIGIKQLNEIRYQKMWQIFEELIKNKTISNKNVDCNFDDFDEEEFQRNIEEELDKKHKEAIADKEKQND